MAWVLFLSISLFPLAGCNADSHPEYEPPYGEKLKPKPFQYEYGLQSSISDAAYTKKESQDDQGNVYGEVVVALPDGRIQTINYNADFYDGYNADVKYAGTAEYPPEQPQNYNGPKFIPVHLKSRPGVPAIPPQPDKVYHKSRPSASAANLGFKNYPYRNRQKQNVLQQEFKSAESSEVNIPEQVVTPMTPSSKEQEITFESVKINPISLPGEATRSSGQNTRKRPQNFAISSDTESMAEMMAKIREDLKNVGKAKETPIIIPESNTQFTLTDTKGTDSMAEIMQKIRNDLQTSEKLRIEPANPNGANFQNRPLTPSKPDNMAEIMKKIREDLMEKEVSTPSRLPSLNPETPPLMVIKSHVMPAPKDKMAEIMKRLRENKNKIAPKSPAVMSIKSHVISAPPVAESMSEIMKKIREDLIKNSEQSTKVELPSPVMQIKSQVKTQEPEVTEGMMDIVKNIRQELQKTEEAPRIMSIKSNVKQAPKVMQVMSHVIENPSLNENENGFMNEFPTNKPLRDSVVDFMKKVELMKEKENDFKSPIMSVKSRVIQQTNQDSDGLVSMKIKSRVIPENSRLEAIPLSDVPSSEETTNSVRY